MNELQAVPPLLNLAPGCVALGQGSIVLDLVSQAEDRDGIAYGRLGLACFEALVAAPEREGSQVIYARREELPLRTGRRGDVYPRRGPAAGSGRGVGQQLPPFRLADGQHGPHCTAARHQIVAILDLIAPRAAPDIDRAHALRQGELLGSAPCSCEIVTIWR